MSIASDSVATFRTEWADRFVDACQIVDTLNDTDRGEMDPDTYQYDEHTAGVVYTGPCLLRTADLDDAANVFGQQAVTYTGGDLYLPFDSPAVDLDQLVTVTASVRDPQLVGTVWVIRSIIRDAYLTRRKIVVEHNLGTGIAF